MGSNTHVTCNEVNAITSHESCRGHVTFWSVMCIDISTVRIFQSKNKTLDWKLKYLHCVLQFSRYRQFFCALYLSLADPAGVCVCGGLAVVSTSCCQQKPAAALSGYIELSTAITNPSPPIHSLRPPANPYPTLHFNNIISFLFIETFKRKTFLIMEDFSVLDSLNQKITISNI